MRKTWLTASALALALGFTTPASAEMTLKAAHYLSPKHPVGVGYEVFAKKLEEGTDGEIKLRIFPGQALLGAKAISDGIRDQVANVGFATWTYTPSYYPHGILLNDLAMLGENDMAAVFAITELFTLHCKPCLAEFAKQNQVFLTGMSTAPYVLVANTELNSAEKIKGKKLRAGGSLWDRFASFVGGTGVNVPSAEIYESLSRGIIDAAIYAVGGLKSHGLADVASNVVLLNLGSFRAGSLYSFNKDTWKEMTPDQRKVAYKAASAAVVRTTVEYHKADEEAVELAKEKKIPILDPDPSLVKAKADFVEDDQPFVLKNAKEKLGIADPTAFVDKYKELLGKYEKLVGPIEGDQDKLAALLYDEVFAKLGDDYGVK